MTAHTQAARSCSTQLRACPEPYDPETTVNQSDHPTAKTRVVLWPTLDDAPFDCGDLSLTEANADELRFYAEHYADVPLRELMRRLRLAEWNAAHYRQQAEEARQATRDLPPMHKIREMDARHTRIRGLLATPGRISRADLEAALREPAPTTPLGDHQ